MMTPLGLLAIAFTLAGFGVGMLLLAENIKFRYRRREQIKELQQMGRDQDAMEAAYQRTRDREQRLWRSGF